MFATHRISHCQIQKSRYLKIDKQRKLPTESKILQKSLATTALQTPSANKSTFT
jgi:hypothetical protein